MEDVGGSLTALIGLHILFDSIGPDLSDNIISSIHNDRAGMQSKLTIITTV